MRYNDEEVSRMKNEKTVDSRYIQQHLANERTYLAWIRTALTIMGIGYLSAKLHFLSSLYPIDIGDKIAQIIGVVSIAIGLSTIGYATLSYIKKEPPLITKHFNPLHTD